MGAKWRIYTLDISNFPCDRSLMGAKWRIITGSLEFSAKTAYSKCFGRFFNLSFVSSSVEDFNFSFWAPSSSSISGYSSTNECGAMSFPWDSSSFSTDTNITLWIPKNDKILNPKLVALLLFYPPLKNLQSDLTFLLEFVDLNLEIALI